MLHLNLQKEVLQGSNLLKYLNNHEEDFHGVFAPSIIARMQIIVTLFTEIINIILICGQSDVMDCIFNFIALGAIAEIDNYYFRTINIPVKEAIKDSLPIKKSSKEIEL